IKVDENQVGGLGGIKQLQRIAYTNIKARIVIQPEVFDGQARYIRAQLNGFDIFERQELEACLGQRAGTEAEEQRGFRLFMAQRANQHGPGVVILEPARIGGEHAALLDGITEFEKTV